MYKEKEDEKRKHTIYGHVHVAIVQVYHHCRHQFGEDLQHKFGSKGILVTRTELRDCLFR